MYCIFGRDIGSDTRSTPTGPFSGSSGSPELPTSCWAPRAEKIRLFVFARGTGGFGKEIYPQSLAVRLTGITNTIPNGPLFPTLTEVCFFFVFPPLFYFISSSLCFYMLLMSAVSVFPTSNPFFLGSLPLMFSYPAASRSA